LVRLGSAQVSTWPSPQSIHPCRGSSSGRSGRSAGRLLSHAHTRGTVLTDVLQVPMLAIIRSARCRSNPLRICIENHTKAKSFVHGQRRWLVDRADSGATDGDRAATFGTKSLSKVHIRRFGFSGAESMARERDGSRPSKKTASIMRAMHAQPLPSERDLVRFLQRFNIPWDYKEFPSATQRWNPTT
jgi:hypothetical protein